MFFLMHRKIDYIYTKEFDNKDRHERIMKMLEDIDTYCKDLRYPHVFESAILRDYQISFREENRCVSDTF